MNLTGIALGGMVKQQNELADQQARNRQLDIAQQGVDVQRLGVTNARQEFLQRLAVDRMNATMANLVELKKSVTSPADLPGIANTANNLLADIQHLAALSGL